MRVRVLFFGMLKEIAGVEAENREISDGSSPRDLFRQYADQKPRMSGLAESIAMAVNQEYVDPSQELREGDEVAFLPPVSGGSNGTGKTTETRVAIVRDPIHRDSALDGFQSPTDGALVVFEGVARNHTRGRRTVFLDYEAYEPMALKELEALAEQARTEFKIRDVVLVHRLGRLEIGETSVLIAVASAHRGPAFEACRWLIDTLKKRVPIWKKEHFEDGVVWADGEPFPAGLDGTSSRDEKPASK